MRLPVRIEDITSDWLSEALDQRYPGTQVTASRVDKVLWGTGTKVRVELQYNDRGRAHGLPGALYVKGGFAEHRALMERCYELEARFYRDLQPLLELNAPQALFTGDDPEARQHIVLLEDLDLRGVRFCRVQEPLDFAQAAAHLDIIARYQARWWDSPELRPGGLLGDLPIWEALPPGEAGAYHWGQLQPEVWDEYIRLPRGVTVPRHMLDRERMQAALLALSAFGRAEPHCFLHGDYHLGNLYSDADGRPGTLDWQSFCKGHWSHDVTYFMVSALDIADRKRWDMALLGHYLERLRLHGVERPPSFEEAYEAFRRQILDGLYFWLVNPVEFQAEVNNCAVVPRFAMAALDHGTFAALLG